MQNSCVERFIHAPKFPLRVFFVFVVVIVVAIVFVISLIICGESAEKLTHE